MSSQQLGNEKRQQQQDDGEASRGGAKRQKREVDGVVLSLNDLPCDVLLRILLCGTVRELASVACVNRQLREAAAHPKLSQELWFTYRISQNPTSIDVLYKALQTIEERGWFQRFPQLRIVGCNNLQNVSTLHTCPERKFLTGLSLSVTRLDISLDPTLSQKHRKVYAWVPKFFASAVPHLTHVNMSYISTPQSAITSFANNCQNLESLTWQSCRAANAFVTGQDFCMTPTHGKLQHPCRIREVIMDGAKMYTYEDVESEESDRCILCFLKATLRRVSIRCLTYYRFGQRPIKVSQQTLIKFVRSMPHLVWLRSDLDAASVAALRSERPEIEFV